MTWPKPRSSTTVLLAFFAVLQSLPSSAAPTTESIATSPASQGRNTARLALILGTVIGAVCAAVALAFAAHKCIRTRGKRQTRRHSLRVRRDTNSSQKDLVGLESSVASEAPSEEVPPLPALPQHRTRPSTPPPPPRPPSPAVHFDTRYSIPSTPSAPQFSEQRRFSISSRFSTRSRIYDVSGIEARLANANLPPPSYYKAIVSEPYEAFEDDEMELKIGDLVNVFKVFEDGELPDKLHNPFAVRTTLLISFFSYRMGMGNKRYIREKGRLSCRMFERALNQSIPEL